MGSSTKLTVFFEDPFWVAIAEEEDERGYRAARHVFGAEPIQSEVERLVLDGWDRLRFTETVAECSTPGERKMSFKRRQRIVKKEQASQVGCGTKNISKGDFQFANCAFFGEILPSVEAMPDDTVEQIIGKYVEMNIAHPFMEGNGRATRIWLDMLLKKRLGKCVDWRLIDKKDYLEAMEASVVDSSCIQSLIAGALTDGIDNRELFMKGIDYSYYYEVVDE